MIRWDVVDAVELGWRVETWGEGVIVRMPKVTNVAERDGAWRAACAAIEARFGLAPALARPAP